MASEKRSRKKFYSFLRDFGLFMQLPGYLAISGALVAIVAREFRALPGFLFLIVLAFGLGTMLEKRYTKTQQDKHSFSLLVVSASWVTFAVLGAIPFFLTAWLASASEAWTQIFQSPLNALFESMSGFTSTGLSVASDPSTLPRSLQWWRTVTEWMGGLGVILFAIAFLRPRENRSLLLTAETQELLFEGNVRTTAVRMLGIYAKLTVISILLFLLAGMPGWEAINHGLTGIATGGFSIKSDSFQSYGPPIYLAGIVIMFLAALPFHTFFYLAHNRKWAPLAKNTQIRLFFVLILIGGGIITWLRFSEQAAESQALTMMFQYISAIATCGFSAMEAPQMFPSFMFLLILGMMVGGTEGSTTGGIKLSRIAWLGKGVEGELRNILGRRRRGKRYTFDGKRMRIKMAQKKIRTAGIFLFLYLLLTAIGSWVILVVEGDRYTMQAIWFDVTSAIGNVGLSKGVVEAGMNPLSKAVFLFLMWIGRLEIFAVLALFAAPFARDGNHPLPDS